MKKIFFALLIIAALALAITYLFIPDRIKITAAARGSASGGQSRGCTAAERHGHRCSCVTEEAAQNGRSDDSEQPGQHHAGSGIREDGDLGQLIGFGAESPGRHGAAQEETGIVHRRFKPT